jgi:phage shock protein PspC (stress-responsive transcriptional regulator)
MTHLETEPGALPPPTPETPPAERRWARSDDRVILGVAGGLGRALAIDPLVIRIAFVVLALFSGVGIAFTSAACYCSPTRRGRILRACSAGSSASP